MGRPEGGAGMIVHCPYCGCFLREVPGINQDLYQCSRCGVTTDWRGNVVEA